MLSDQITCMANQYDEQSKDPVIDDARKTYQLCVPISSYRLRTKSVRKYKHAGCDDRVPCSILCKNALSLFHKGKVIKNYIVNNWRKLYRAPLNVESILSSPL